MDVCTVRLVYLIISIAYTVVTYFSHIAMLRNSCRYTTRVSLEKGGRCHPVTSPSASPETVAVVIPLT